MAGKKPIFDTGNAAKGAAVGSVVPGVGTVVGATLGGFFGDDMAEFDPTAGGQPPAFKPPEYKEGDTYETSYDPNAVEYTPEKYAGALNTQLGGDTYQTLEEDMGVEKFDGGRYRDALKTQLVSDANATTRARTAAAGDAAASQGVTQGGAARARKDLLAAEGDRTVAMGTVAGEGDIAQMQQQEAARRLQGALGIADTNLENEKFGAQFTEGQEQFGANFNESQSRFLSDEERFAAGITEQQRQVDNDSTYGEAQDTYLLNEVAPIERRDKRKGAVMDAGTSIIGAATGAAGMALGKK